MSHDKHIQIPGGGSIVLIHGLWVSSLSWEHWIGWYTGQGHTVIARSWPGMEGDIDELRRDPSAIAGLTTPSATPLPRRNPRPPMSDTRSPAPQSSAVTDFKEFPDRSHFTIGEASWEQVADYALDWAVAHFLEPAA